MNSISWSRHILICALFISIFFGIQSCKRELLVPNSSLKNSLSIEEAKQYYFSKLQQPAVAKKTMSTSSPTKETMQENPLVKKQIGREPIPS
ncbi:hypothetical protein [Pedobacter kyonggii]|uniref:Uncharacterized protein n=1 Tax=Pedobacter kyonggii TaxID=1926871 RepID=A0A4Q9HH59_9SPHI|nr:hypothetical protein [Pedobacter kyonggii]TBO44455.1 hypothetical protein EYS08_03880 [Pedobacter kyonggii]